MLGFIIFILQATPQGEVVVRAVSPEGVRIVLENTRFEAGKEVKWETRIKKLGEKLRIEETFPNSEEIGEVIIWDGKKCMLFMPNHRPQLIPPVRNGLEFLGFRGEVKEKDMKWEIEKAKNLPLKKETRHGITQYKGYVLIENFGYFPALIERYSERKLQLRTELKHTEKEMELSHALFYPELVEFSEEAKKLAKKLYKE